MQEIQVACPCCKNKRLFDADPEQLKSLTDEKKRLCKMIANKESERSVAKELGIAQTTLNGRKKKLLAEMAESLREYK